MKYEHIPTPQNNKTRKIATCFFFSGLILFVVGGVKMIPFRSIIQVAAMASFTISILLVGRFLLRSFAYRIEDMGEGDEFFVDEITRKSRYSVCRLEMRKLVAVHDRRQLSKDERAKKHYNYCPDAFSDESYVLEFVDSEYDVTSERIRIRIQPDEKLLSILKETALQNATQGAQQSERQLDKNED